MSIKSLKRAIAQLAIGDAAPYLILGWTENRRVVAGTYPITEDMADDLRIIAQQALDLIANIDMAEYDGPTVISHGEEGVWVPANRLNENSAIFAMLKSSDDLDLLTARDLEGRSLSFYAIGFGSDEDDRAFFVKRQARQYQATSQILAVLRGPLRPLRASVIALERNTDFILCDEGAVVFETRAFEKYVQDPEDVEAELDENLDAVGAQLPFDDETLEALKELGRKGTMLRLRVRSILGRDHFGELDISKVRAEFRRLKIPTRKFISDGRLKFPMKSAQLVMKILDESAWRGGFSDNLYTTNSRHKEA